MIRGNSQEISSDTITSRTHLNLGESSGRVTWRDITLCPRYIWKPDTTGYYPALPGTTGKVVCEHSPISSNLGHIYHNSVALYRYLRVTPSLATTMH
eukprot:1369083-Amorphochlora_amoeboformis.AAC.1